MTNEMIEKKSPEQLGAEIRMYVDAGRRISLLCGIEIGQRLTQAKEMLQHGEWLPWLERETEFSDRSAQRYMKLFEEYGSKQQGLFGPETNATTLSDLPISKAFALLSVPESERESFAEEVDAEHISVKELEKAIKEKQDAEKALEDLKKDIDGERNALADAQAKIAELEKLNDELEHRPVDVAIETVRDEEAIAEAAKEARKKAEAEAQQEKKDLEKRVNDLNAKLLKAEKDLNKAENERAEAQKKADAAEQGNDAKIAEAKKETERIRAELAEAQKQLKTSAADVTAFGIHFSQIQKEWSAMITELDRVEHRDPETGEKLHTAVRELLKSFGEQAGEK